MHDKPKFLVIGSNSFSGSTFVGYLLESGYKVYGTSRSNQPSDEFLPYKWMGTNSEFSFTKADLNSELNKILDLVGDVRPDYVVNFASQGMVAESWLNPLDWYETNVIAQVALHDQLRKCNFLKKYIHISTPEVYGSTGLKIKESFNFAPSTPYAVSRAACDLHLMSFFKAYQFPVVFTRAANVYGPGQQLYRIIPKTVMSIKMGQKLILHGGGKSVRSFIHMRDVAEATEKIAIHGSPGLTYHISTDTYISVYELVSMVCNLMEYPINNLVEIADDRLGKDQAYLLDSNRLNSDFNWTSKIDLKTGLTETINWIDKNFKYLSKQKLNYEHIR
jgi:dTDP-glucose 4,6-dehydratase